MWTKKLYLTTGTTKRLNFLRLLGNLLLNTHCSKLRALSRLPSTAWFWKSQLGITSVGLVSTFEHTGVVLVLGLTLIFAGMRQYKPGITAGPYRAGIVLDHTSLVESLLPGASLYNNPTLVVSYFLSSLRCKTASARTHLKLLKELPHESGLSNWKNPPLTVYSSGTQFRTSFHPHLAISPLLSLKLSNLGPKVQK